AIEREYLAVVRGKMKQPSGKLENYLVKDRQKNIVHVTKSSVKEAKKAVLYYKVETAAEDLSRVRVQLESGPPHQIRVQMNQAGNTIYWDQKYGQEVNRPGEQISLWAVRLSVKHPTKDEIITVYSDSAVQFPWY